jgi:hypothetical protein
MLSENAFKEMPTLANRWSNFRFSSGIQVYFWMQRCLLRRSTFCFSATVKALHVLEVSSAVSRIDSSRRNGSAGDTPHGMRVLRGSETPKLHAGKQQEVGCGPYTTETDGDPKES